MGSFRIAGFLLLLALVLGIVFGVGLILSRRRRLPSVIDEVSLRLDART